MSSHQVSFRSFLTRLAVAAALGLAPVAAAPVLAEQRAETSVTAIQQAIAEAAADDRDIAAFYRQNGYARVWTGEGEDFRQRRAALIEALSGAEAHGLPARRYDVDGLMRQMETVRTVRDLAQAEVALSNVFLRYARDVQTGVTVPSRIDDGIKREVPYRDRQSILMAFSETEPFSFIRGLPPRTLEYTALMNQKLRMERLVAAGGWGAAIPAGRLSPGDSGAQVVALRDRLVAMGFLRPTASQVYDAEMQEAVQRAQEAHGLEADGVAGENTIAALNVPAEERLKSILVAMERERWLNRDRGDRHILVNLTDFHAQIIDHGKVTFRTRSVIGASSSDRQSPEFSDVMDHMVINPSWYVPRSIIVNEYLPALRQNPYAVSHIQITDRRGRVVNRGAVDFRQFSKSTFPFAMRQPPSNDNALGLVKFMFPNKYNIYLHDTPQKHLFDRQVRAFSHGCIRLNDPFEFAYELLSRQEADPKAFFHQVLDTGRETRVTLDQPVPVHLIYRTAFTTPKGGMKYRDDVYGRDAKIWEALDRAGVALPAVRG